MPVLDRDRWLALEPLLDRALDLEGAERERFLAALAVSSPDLAAELRTLLDGSEAAERSGFLAHPLEISLAGLQLGAWTLERPLGEGGMGTVWLARRTDGRFEGAAAVKLLNLSLRGDSMQRRFQREGSALARLAHSGIARLLDAGVGPGGQPYLVLEYVDGTRIDEWVDARRLGPEAIVRLMLQVIEAVGHAHANLIVHRDLKPSNILVTRDGVVKLLDFGIAKLLDQGANTGEEALTREGMRALTPEYASPEQVLGDPVTTATDVYALGVLLYELLSGRHPTNDGVRGPGDVLHAVVEREPAPLPLGDLGTVVGRALRKVPAERYQSAAALADDLRRWLAHEPVAARPQTPLYRLRRFVRRHRAGVAAGALVTVALLGATAFSVAQMREANRQRDAAVAARRRADAQVEFESVLLSQLGDRPMTMRQILDRGRAVLERSPGVSREAEPDLLVQLATRYAELGDRETPRRLLARAESLAAETGPRARVLALRCLRAGELRLEGRYDDARRGLAASFAALAQAPDPVAEATCLAERAELETETGHPEVSGPAIRRALAIRDSLGDTTSTEYVKLLGGLAYSLDRERRPRESVATFKRALALLESSGRHTMAARLVLQHDMALTLLNVGETREAERLLHGVLIDLQANDPDAELPQQPLIHYGHAALHQGQLDSARRYFTRLVAQAESSRRPYWVGRALFGLARVELAAGRLDAAREAAGRMRPIDRATYGGRTDDEVTDVRVLDARLALTSGDAARAHALVRAALDDAGWRARPTRSVLRPSMLLAGEASLALGRADEARAWAGGALRIAARDSLTATRSAFVGEARLLEARARLAAGDTSGARPALAAALVALRGGGGLDHPGFRQADALAAALGGAMRPVQDAGGRVAVPTAR